MSNSMKYISEITKESFVIIQVVVPVHPLGKLFIDMVLLLYICDIIVTPSLCSILLQVLYLFLVLCMDLALNFNLPLPKTSVRRLIFLLSYPSPLMITTLNSIGWSYGNPRTVTVNHYERQRQQKQSITNYPFGWHRRLVQQAMVLSRFEREQLLEEWNIPHSDIIKAIRQNVKSKFDRRQTIRNTHKGVEKLELLFEGASKTLKRKLRLRKHTSEETKSITRKSETSCFGIFNLFRYNKEC